MYLIEQTRKLSQKLYSCDGIMMINRQTYESEITVLFTTLPEIFLASESADIPASAIFGMTI